jgi:long-chain acyl-CoA synthetase
MTIRRVSGSEPERQLQFRAAESLIAVVGRRRLASVHWVLAADLRSCMERVDWALASTVREWVGRKADNACLTFEDRTYTWCEVYERASRLGQGLLGAGLQPQDRVIYLGKNRPEFFEILVGASMAGVVTAALNWRLAPPEMLFILNHSEAKVLFVEAEFLEPIEQIRPQLTSVEKFVVIGDIGDADRYEEWLGRHPSEDPAVKVAETDTAFQMYTAGTTGVPKGAMFSNAAVRAVVGFADLMSVDQDAVVLIAMPVFHAVGSLAGAQALGAGATLVIARDFMPDSLLALIEKRRITSASLVPAALKMLMEDPHIHSWDLTSLQAVSYSSSPITTELLDAVVGRFDCSVMQIYGLTETGLATILATEDHKDPLHPERRLSCGQAVSGVSLRIVDPMTGVDVGEGEQGEVWVRCATQMSGYWNAPAETAATITADGHIRTGDGGYLQDGYLYLQDRIKDMVVSGGENVYPIEVENVLIRHPGINDVAAIGVPSSRWGETVKALVVRQPWAAELTADEIIDFARQYLARYKCPTSIEFLSELPRSGAGKVLKRALRESYASR